MALVQVHLWICIAPRWLDDHRVYLVESSLAAHFEIAAQRPPIEACPHLGLLNDVLVQVGRNGSAARILRTCCVVVQDPKPNRKKPAATRLDAATSG